MTDKQYFKCVKGLEHIDIYRVLDLFGIKDATISHAIKKLLAAGRPATAQDVADAIEALQRYLTMKKEDTDSDNKTVSPHARISTNCLMGLPFIISDHEDSFNSVSQIIDAKQGGANVCMITTSFYKEMNETLNPSQSVRSQGSD